MYYPNNMYDKPIPDVNWPDEAIIDYARLFLPHLPVVFVPLGFQVRQDGPDTAKIDGAIVTRFKER